MKHQHGVCCLTAHCFHKGAWASLVLLLCLLFPFTALAFPPAETPLLAGIDVSVWQGEVDFERVRDSGVEVVYIRAGEGDNHKDPWLERHYEAAEKAGMKIGFYHFVNARSTADAQKQARYFLSLIGGKRSQLRPVIDMGDMAGLTDSEITAIAQAFLSEVEALSGQRGGIYIDASGARDILGASLTKYPLWVANYGVDEPEDNEKWAGWAGWQYTNQGRVPGVKGYVDRDYFNQAMFLEDSTAAPPVDPPAQDDNQVIVTVRRGDTLKALAARYDTTASSIARINDLPDPNLIFPGQRLVIRQGWKPMARYLDYIVQEGDTLSALAARYGTTVESIVRLNHIADPNRITTGQQLRIAVNSQDAVYVVQRGDTLGRIARWSGLPLRELAHANGIQNENLIYPGERILLRP